MVERATGIRVGVEGGDRFRTEMRALGADGQRALKRIETAGRPASKSLLAVNAAAREARSGLQRYAGAAGPAGTVLAAMGPAGLAAAAGIGVSVLAIGRLTRAAREAVDELDDIAKTADNIGLTTDALQELRFAGERMGVEVNQLDSGLEAFGKRLGELRAGTGSLNTLLNKTDPAFREMLVNARNNDEALDLLLRRMAGTADQADRLALSAAAFGRGPGIEMAKVVRDGADAMERVRREAREFGAVIDQSILRTAEKTSDELTNLQTIIDANLRQAFVNLSPEIIAGQRALAEFSRVAREVAQDLNIVFHGLETASAQALRDRLASINEEIERTQEILAEAEAAESGEKGPILEFLNKLPLGLTNAEDLRARLRDLNSQAVEINALLSERARPDAAIPPPAGAGGGGDGSEIDQVQKTIDALQLELDQLGRTELGKRTIIELRKAGADATREEEQQIVGLVRKIQEETDADKARTEAAKAAQQARDQLQRSAQSLIEGTRTAAQRLEAQIQDLQEAIDDGLVDSPEAAAAAMATLNQRLEEARHPMAELESLIAGTRTESERLETQIRELQQAIDEGLVKDPEAAGVAMERLKQRLAEANVQSSVVAGTIKDGINRTLDGTTQALLQNELEWDNWARIANTALVSVLANIIKLATTGGVDALFAGGGGAGGGSLVASLFGGGQGAQFTGTGIEGLLSSGSFARGGVFEHGRVTAFASGAVIDRPTIFPMANGAGLAGEAGPEAILPLERIRGQLGVNATGAQPVVVQPTPVNVVINNETGVPSQIHHQRRANGDLLVTIARAVAADMDARGPSFAAVRRNFKVMPTTG